MYSNTTPLTSSQLVDSNGVGRYNAILLTNALLLSPDGNGGWASDFDATEWNTLWSYERDYAVRQAVLYASYGTWPEDYCLRAGSEGGVGDTTVPATLTTGGAAVFDQLKAGAKIPLQQSWVYRNTLAPGCGGVPLLTLSDGSVVGVRSVSPDGRERVALSFTSNQYLLQSDLLVYGLFRWASRGMYLGDQRHYLKVDVDDWFNSADILNADGTMSPTPYQVSGAEVYNLSQKVLALRSANPLARNFTFSLAYNGEGLDLTTGTKCSPTGGVATLSATSRCLRNNFEWINHTYTHADMNTADLASSLSEINDNFTVGTTAGLNPQPKIVKTGEYSGLGTYSNNPDDDVDPPIDHGLMASNPNLLTAAQQLGVKYLHGNMSFPSQVPSCFNCNIPHPMAPSISIVPDWPTNIAYFSSTPEQETYFYNWYYGPNGKFPYWPVNQTYEQVIAHESDQGMSHVATGSMYTHTMHIANVHNYGAGRTLAMDWVQAVVSKYSSFYSVPLLTPSWAAMADLTTTWRTHFATKDAVSAVYDPVTKKISVTSTQGGSVIVSGTTGTGSSAYGTSTATTLAVTTGSTVTVAAKPMS